MLTSIILCFILFDLILLQRNTSINYSDPNIKELITIASTKNKTTKLSVYSIQIQATENPEKILKTKKKYLSKFPEERIDEIFEAPYFKLISGYYLDKKQAEKKLKKIKKQFKSSFVLKREVHINEFKESRN